MACYGLSPTVKGSSKGCFAFWKMVIICRGIRLLSTLCCFRLFLYWSMCSSTELICNSWRISVFLFLSNFVYTAVLLRNLISLAIRKLNLIFPAINIRCKQHTIYQIWSLYSMRNCTGTVYSLDLLYSKSPINAVNSFRRFPRKSKNRVSWTMLKYDVFLTYMFVSKDN
jgi:hypothetical protein